MPMGRVTVTLPADVLSDIDSAEKNRSAFILEAVRRELSRRRRRGRPMGKGAGVIMGKIVPEFAAWREEKMSRPQALGWCRRVLSFCAVYNT